MLAVGLILAILLLGPGYLLWLRYSALRARKPVASPTVPQPEVDIVVPLRDEALYVEGKIQNLLALEYPKESLRFWLVDGASTDSTLSALSELVQKDSRFQILSHPVGNKIAQLNAALTRCTASWVLVTDADARMSPETVKKMVQTAESSPRIGVVGTSVDPGDACQIERLHWNLLNSVRRLEAEHGTASLAVGPCYMFRRNLLSSFPDDVVADDAFVSLKAAVDHQTVAFVDADVVELRSPTYLLELFGHKLRKANAYLREIGRFLPSTYRMRSPARGLFLWRAAQFILLPILNAALLAAVFSGAFTLLDFSGALLIAAIGFPGVHFACGKPVPSQLLALCLFAILSAVLTVNLVTYPFLRQTASYPKVGSSTQAER